MKILISGLTAAGKTTTAVLLAERFGIPVVSWLSVMREVIADTHPDLAKFAEFTPAHDAIRVGDDTIDRQVDELLLDRARVMDSGVFDAWALPWRVRSGGVRLWIDSDEPSRIRKLVVSRAMRAESPDPDPAASLRRKDALAREKLRRLYGFDVATDRKPFDVIVTNETLIPVATIETAKAGIARFEPVVQQCIELAAGARARVDAEHAPFVLRCRKRAGG